jgi:hypothetical protein
LIGGPAALGVKWPYLSREPWPPYPNRMLWFQTWPFTSFFLEKWILVLWSALIINFRYFVLSFEKSFHLILFLKFLITKFFDLIFSSSIVNFKHINYFSNLLLLFSCKLFKTTFLIFSIYCFSNVFVLLS